MATLRNDDDRDSQPSEHQYSSEDFSKRHFQDGLVQVSIEILKETLDEMRALFAQNGLDESAGLRMLLTQGLGYAVARLTLEGQDEDHTRMVQRLAQVESMYAVMKRETYNFMSDNRVLEMQNAALRSSIETLNKVVALVRSDNKALKAELASCAKPLLKPSR